jgi:hypothetical protein
MAKSDVDVRHRAGFEAQQIYRANPFIAQTQRQRVDRPETVLAGALGEPWPPIRIDVEVVDQYRLSCAIRQQTRARVGLYLQNLQQPRLLAARCEYVQVAVCAEEHDPSCVNPQQRHRVVNKLLRQFDDVVVGDQRIG